MVHNLHDLDRDGCACSDCIEWCKQRSLRTLSKDELEELGKGKCDHCESVHDIGRGENFVLDEVTSEWLCRACANERGVEW